MDQAVEALAREEDQGFVDSLRYQVNPFRGSGRMDRVRAHYAEYLRYIRERNSDS